MGTGGSTITPKGPSSYFGETRATYVRLMRADGSVLPFRARRCDDFACRLRGLMFQRRPPTTSEALLFMERVESRLGTAIHMFFVFFPIGVVWLDDRGIVVDTVIAKPFRPVYLPRAPAKFFLEGAPVLVEWVKLGERLTIVPAEETVDASD